MKIATCAYHPQFLPDWQDYEDKITAWVADAAGQGAELLVFPEYAGMELAGLAGAEVSADLHGSIRAASEHFPRAVDLHAKLAKQHGVYILQGSAPVQDGDRVVNRAAFLAPSGDAGFQDKQIMTRFEREEWGVSGGGPLRLFDTALGKVGVLICYDCEFPDLARALTEADVILVPSATEALAGYWRVRIGAMARALEQQCVTVMASLTGKDDRLYAVEEDTGAGGIFGPPDRGFPSDGVIALGRHDSAEWTLADVDLGAVAAVRADGVVLNRRHWEEQSGRDGTPETVSLR